MKDILTPGEFLLLMLLLVLGALLYGYLTLDRVAPPIYLPY